MAANSYKLKVYSPAGLVLEEEVKSVTLPSSNGEIGVLPGHTKYVGLLGSGELRCDTVSGEPKKLKISGGFCNFSGNVFNVLSD